MQLLLLVFNTTTNPKTTTTSTLATTTVILSFSSFSKSKFINTLRNKYLYMYTRLYSGDGFGGSKTLA